MPRGTQDILVSTPVSWPAGIRRHSRKNRTNGDSKQPPGRIFQGQCKVRLKADGMGLGWRSPVPRCAGPHPTLRHRRLPQASGATGRGWRGLHCRASTPSPAPQLGLGDGARRADQARRRRERTNDFPRNAYVLSSAFRAGAVSGPHPGPPSAGLSLPVNGRGTFRDARNEESPPRLRGGAARRAGVGSGAPRPGLFEQLAELTPQAFIRIGARTRRPGAYSRALPARPSARSSHRPAIQPHSSANTITTTGIIAPKRRPSHPCPSRKGRK